MRNRPLPRHPASDTPQFGAKEGLPRLVCRAAADRVCAPLPTPVPRWLRWEVREGAARDAPLGSGPHTHPQGPNPAYRPQIEEGSSADVPWWCRRERPSVRRSWRSVGGGGATKVGGRPSFDLGIPETVCSPDRRQGEEHLRGLFLCRTIIACPLSSQSLPRSGEYLVTKCCSSSRRGGCGKTGKTRGRRMGLPGSGSARHVTARWR